MDDHSKGRIEGYDQTWNAMLGSPREFNESIEDYYRRVCPEPMAQGSEEYCRGFRFGVRTAFRTNFGPLVGTRGVL